MSAAEFRRRAALCRKAAGECSCTIMRRAWMLHANTLETEALRAERYAERWEWVKQ